MKLLSDFISLIYPHLCVGCDRALYDREKLLCTYCNFDLPPTNFHLHPDNKITKLFWGKVPVEGATALYHFQKGGLVQRLIHQLKYRGKTEVGDLLGKRLGVQIKDTAPFKTVDAVLPVPLHPKKERKRGYNQSFFIAQGVAAGMGIACMPHHLIRSTHTASQTRKSLFDRWKNVETVFEVVNPQALEGRSVLLVDDVLTTGSTLEACVRSVLKVPGTRVSVATLACA